MTAQATCAEKMSDMYFMGLLAGAAMVALAWMIRSGRK